jgi:hypothetical protein
VGVYTLFSWRENLHLGQRKKVDEGVFGKLALSSPIRSQNGRKVALFTS